MDVIFETKRRAFVVYWTLSALKAWKIQRWTQGRTSIQAWRFLAVYRDEENRLPRGPS